jgi:hypothetical protein
LRSLKGWSSGSSCEGGEPRRVSSGFWLTSPASELSSRSSLRLTVNRRRGGGLSETFRCLHVRSELQKERAILRRTDTSCSSGFSRRGGPGRHKIVVSMSSWGGARSRQKGRTGIRTQVPRRRFVLRSDASSLSCLMRSNRS